MSYAQIDAHEGLWGCTHLLYILQKCLKGCLGYGLFVFFYIGHISMQNDEDQAGCILIVHIL